MSAYASTSGSSSPFGAGGYRSNSPAFASPSFSNYDPSASTSSAIANPTTRSRTLLFISYRDSIVRAPKRRRLSDHHDTAYGDTELLFNADADDEQARLIGGSHLEGGSGGPGGGSNGGHVSLDMDAKLPPKW